MMNSRLAAVFLCAACYAAAVAQEPKAEGPADRAVQPRELSAQVERLILQLGDEQFDVREAASKSLVEIGNFARTALQKAAESPDAEVAMRAKGIIASIPKVSHTLLDGLGLPIPFGTVEVSITRAGPPGEAPAVRTARALSDELGRVAIPNFDEPEVTAVARIHHSEYGTARCEIGPRQTVLRVPIVRAGTEARSRAIVGQVVAADGIPVANAVVHCNEVRTPGMGLLSGVSPQGDVLTQSDGRFTFYLANLERDRQEQKLIPPNSLYALQISVPGDDSYFPIAGLFGNVEPARLEMPRATRFHRFRVSSAAGGWLESIDQLRNVRLQFVHEQDGRRMLTTLDSAALWQGRKLVPGKYHADLYAGGKHVTYQPLLVTAESPEVLELQLPPTIRYRGRVLHGITGKPLAKAYVMGWRSTSRNNLALLTADDWKLLREDESSPAPVDSLVVKRLNDFYGVQGLVRTDAEGRFELIREPDQEFYGLLAFDENLVPFKIRVGGLKANEKQVVEAGEFPLFPAAKVQVRPVFAEGRLSVSPRWLPTDEGQPDWFERFKAASKSSDREFEYVHWLALNDAQPIYVPAGIRLRLAFECPYHDAWSPATFEVPMQLKSGESHDLGDLRFSAALHAVVRVVDRDGNPLEGVPIRRMYSSQNIWSIVHNSDQDGRANFHVKPNSKGTFRVLDIPGDKATREAANLGIEFAVQDKAPADLYELRVTDEQLRLLRGGKPGQ